METVQDSGSSTLGSFAYFDPNSSSWKTSALSLFEGSTKFSGTWPPSGTMRSGRCSERVVSAHRTGESACSYSPVHKAEFPTPSATAYGSSGNGTGNNVESRGRPSLETMAKQGLWPTPTDDSSSGTTLPLAATTGRWPTPTAGDAKASGSRNLEGSKAHAGVSLTDAVLGTGAVRPRRFATPTTQDGHNNGSPSQQARNSPPLNAQIGGRLNPQWVEWLMGLPTDWTALVAPAESEAVRIALPGSAP